METWKREYLGNSGKLLTINGNAKINDIYEEIRAIISSIET